MELRRTAEAKLFEAAVDLSALRDFTQGLRQKTLADGAVIRFVDFRDFSGAITVECGSGLFGQKFFADYSSYQAIDPHIRVALNKTLPYPEIYVCSEHYDDEHRASDPYFHTFLAAHDIGWAAGYMVTVDQKMGAGVVVARSKSKGAFQQDVKAALTPTAMILEDAARIIWNTQHEKLKCVALEKALYQPQAQHLCVDRHLQLIWGDRAALKSFKEIGFSIKATKTDYFYPVSPTAFELAELLKNPHDATDHPAKEIVAKSESGIIYRAIIRRLCAEKGAMTSCGITGFLISIERLLEKKESTGSGSQIIQKLSPTELEIARSYADGAKSTDIAVARSIKITTVKSHLKRIYRKLSINNRSELTILRYRGVI